MEAPEHKKRQHIQQKQHINKRRKKENRRKLNERKRKRTENNVQRVHGTCVGDPLGNLPYAIVHPPSIAVPEEYIKVEDVATSLFRRDRLYIVHVQICGGELFHQCCRKQNHHHSL